ncbi:cytidine deaminase-like protein [Panaeolus papilionaceus]|nr:cytidine deaminase-like protein [Panaeolus papilionaceus]
MPDWSTIDKMGISLALSQAHKSQEEGGIPIGSALIVPNGASLTILGSGHNERIQKSSPTLHAEIAALENAGRLPADLYKQATMYTTLSPCSMCTGSVLLYKIPRVVIGENTNFMGDEDLLRARGVEVIVLDDGECKSLMQKFIAEKPLEWNEDIGEVSPE